jgi:hypothetical protein
MVNGQHPFRIGRGGFLANGRQRLAGRASREKKLQAIQELESLKMKAPEIYQDFAKFFDRNRVVGYKNLCKLLMGDISREDLVPEEDEGDGDQ